MISRKYAYLSALISFALYLYFGYFLERYHFKVLVIIAAFLFLNYGIIFKSNLSINEKLSFGILFRLIFILCMPNLSQDYYRFIWDGSLILKGLNPYLYLPNEIIHNTDILIPNKYELYKGMGSLSSSHYTNYPPIKQLFFSIGAFFSKYSILHGVISLHIILLIFDILIFHYGSKLLSHLKKDKELIFLYFLNPFIIIELNANLHFESIMLCFLIISLYFVQIKKINVAGIFYGLSIGVKLIPLIFIPIFIRYLTDKKLFRFYLIIGSTLFFLFLPFISIEFLENYSKTIGLWFTNFEFNASIYYILREIGYSITGRNEIHFIGKILPIIILLLVIYISLIRKVINTSHLLLNMLYCISFYLLLGTTIHPWYISTLVLLCIFNRFRYPILWSLLIFLSYSAYEKDYFNEKLYLVIIEYSVILLFLIFELQPKTTHFKR